MRVMCLLVLLGVATASEGCELAAGELVIASRASAAPLALDGKIDSNEWSGACVMPLPAGFDWRVVMDEQGIRMAWTGPSELPFYVDVYVLDPQGDVVNLHASMQLGERRLPGDAWDDRSPPFAWGDPIGWHANVATVDAAVASSAPFAERLHRRDGIELSLSRERFDLPLVIRFELRDFAGRQADIAYPSGSTRYDRQGWLRLRADDAARSADQATGDAIDRVLAPRVTPGFQSEVAVLGTLHLSNHRDRLQPGQLEPLLALLEAYGPTRIAVETLSADEIALLAEREVHDPAAAEVVRMFARTPLGLGRSMQGVLAMDRIAAARKAQEILQARSGHLSDDDRLELVAYWLAAYEFNSAALQWSYLPAGVRARATNVPTEVRDQLERFLAGSNENVVLAFVLARRLGLQTIIPIDSQYDGVRTLSASADALKELFTDPDRAALIDREHAARATGIEAGAFEGGDLLPLYRYLNSPEHMAGDATQWHWLFAGRHSSGLDRLRYAMWELRNLRQATNIVDAAASVRPERLLVIVGAAHKAALERVLATQLSVRLVEFDALERKPGVPASR
jgi:hypothetical protein